MTQRLAIVGQALLIAAIGVMTGCRTDPSIELLESELRWYEDQLYLLNRQVDQTCIQLDSCRRYNSALQEELGERPNTTTDQPSTSGEMSRPKPKPGSKPTKAEDEPEELDLEVPEVDYGTEVPAPGDGNGSSVPESQSPRKRDEEDSNPSLNLEDMTLNGAAGTVARIMLNQRLTGGCDFDGRPGDDGLTVVIEPQDQRGEYVAVAGEISVILTDPRKTSPDSRLARWDFDAAEVAASMRKSLFGQGAHLELPWPSERPSAKALRVEVSYIGPDGQRFRVGRDIIVEDDSDRLSAIRPAAFHSRAETRRERSADRPIRQRVVR